MTTPRKKLMLAMAAIFALCLGAKADDVHDAVQLWDGGPYWATTNIGAEEPWDYGCYFWWGDTVGYTNTGSAWISVKDGTGFSFDERGNAASTTYGKSNSELLSAGYIDETGNLTSEYDAAYIHWGDTWRMPTDAEFTALISNCTTTWITTNGVSGQLVTGKGNYADRSIFIPAAGSVWGTWFYGGGTYGYYRSSTPDSSNKNYALGPNFGTSGISEYVNDRYSGQPVRPVKIATINITWLDDGGTEIDTTIVPGNAVPTHADPTKGADAPYKWVFTGWMPELEAAVSNTTYTATFKKIADLSLCTSDWTAADGDEIVGETSHKVTIPSGATVTINGVEVAGASGGGAVVPAPAFPSEGASEVVKFAQAEGGKWTITAFAEMDNESRGTDVTDGQIKVYAADTLEALKSITTPAAGATVKETKSAVKATVEVPAPSGKTSQFFKVKFGE